MTERELLEKFLAWLHKNSYWVTLDATSTRHRETQTELLTKFINESHIKEK
jgi:hypothetical protein